MNTVQAIRTWLPSGRRILTSQLQSMTFCEDHSFPTGSHPEGIIHPRIILRMEKHDGRKLSLEFSNLQKAEEAATELISFLEP